MTETDDQDQCRAITNEGHRCTRLAKDGRFCFQHDESDETIGAVKIYRLNYQRSVGPIRVSIGASLWGL